MKKLLLLWLTLLLGLSSLQVSAQDTLTVANGTITNSYVPVYGLYMDDYIRTQIIYPESLMADLVGSTISQLTFYFSTTPSNPANWNATLNCNLGTTAQSAFSSTSYLTDPLDVVWTGTLNVTGNTLTITFETPWTYEGGNLLLEFVSQTDGGYSSASFYGITSTGASISGYNANGVSSITNATQRNFIPKTTFTYVVGDISCHSVSNLSVSNITSSNAQISWAPSVDAGSYILQYKTAAQTWDDDDVVTDFPFDTTYNFSDMLTAMTSYNVRVATMCSNGDTSAWRNVTFKTSCAEIEELPFTVNFDDVPGSTSGTTNNLPDCWNHINNGTSSSYAGYPIVYSGATYALSGSNSLRFYTTTTAGTYSDQIAILPPIDPTTYPISTLQLSFGARCYSSYTLTIVVGVMSNPDDMTTFVPVDTISTSSSTYGFYEIQMTDYDGTGNYIALMAPQPTSSYNAGYVDNIEINLTPACTRPASLSMLSSTETSVVLTWESSAQFFSLHYKLASDSVFTDVENISLDADNTYTLDYLTASSIYEWYVTALCDDGSEISSFTTATFNTECGVVNIFPWSEGFEESWTAVSAFNQNNPSPNCWKIYDGGATSSSYDWKWRYNTTAARVYEGSGSAGCYTDYATEAHNDWLITPLFQLNGNQMISFYAQRATASTTEPEEISIWISEPDAVLVAPDSTNDPLPGFTEIWQSDIPVGAFQRYEVSLADYSGNRYIAFVRRNEPHNGFWLALDNVEVGDIPECAAPNTLLSSNPTSSSIVLSWMGNTTTYNLYYRVVGDSAYTMEANVTLTDDVYLLTGLDNSTAYEWYVTANCTDGTEIPSYTTGQFITLCETITQLPVLWDFEASNPINQMPLCWSVLNQGSSGPKVQFNANNAYHGSGLLYLYNNNPRSTLVLPPFDASSNPVNTLQLRFYAMNMGTYPAWDVVVTGGVMTDPMDASTFTVVDSIHVIGEAGGAYTEYTLSFTQYEGEGEYLALQFYTVNACQWLRVDDMTLEVAPSCSAPDNLSMVSATTSSVSLTWESTATDLTLYYKAASDNEYTAVTNVALDADETYTLSDLSSSTDYSWYLAANCDDGTVATSVISTFSTLCDVITELPWFEGFESTWHATAAFGQDNDAPQCWKIYDGGATSSSYVWKWKYNNTAGRVYEGTSSAVCYTDYATTNHNDWLISPMIQLNGNQQVSFYAQRASASTSEPDEISIWISDEDAELAAPDTTTAPLPGFTQLYQTDIPSGAFQQYVVSLYGYSGNRYIAFVRRNTPNDGYYLSLDNVTVSDLPECAEPTNLQVLGISTTEATVSWSSNASSFNLYYKESSDSMWIEEFGISLDEDGAYSLMNLTPSTNYQWYVEAVCTDTVLSSSIHTFTTLCEDISVPYTENFNNYTVTVSSSSAPSNYPNDILPSCWKFLNRSASSSTYPSAFLTSYSTYAVSGNCLFFKSSNSTPLYAVLPHFSADLNTLQITFTYRNEGTTTSNGTLSLGYMTNPEDVTTFTELHTYPQITTLTEVSEVLSNIPYEAASGFLVFKYTGGSSNNYYLSIDNILVETIPTCPRPVDVIRTDASSSSVTLSWTSNGDESSWEIAYGPVGFDPNDNSANIVTATTNPFEVQNLDPATVYEFYVRAICSATDYSNWSNPAAYSTECVILTAPYSEDFDSYATTSSSATAPSGYPNDQLPLCWSFLNRSTTTSTYPQAFLTTNSSYVVSGNCLFFKSSSSTPLYAVLPEFTDNIQTLMLRFTYRNEGTTASNGTLSVGYMTDPYDATTFTEITTFPQTTTLTADSVVFNTVPTTASNAYIVFKYTGGSANNYYLSIDNVSVVPVGSGPVIPTDPTVATNAANPIAQTTATLNATITNPDNVTITAKGFEWKATTGGTYTSIAGTGTGNTFSANLSGLTANTGYTYKAFITFNGNTVYGSEMTFTTLPEDTPEPCNVPTNLHTTTIQNEAIAIAWDADANVNSWNIQYRPVGGSLTTATSNTNSYTITGLTGLTTYEIQVQANCGDGNLSDWTAAITPQTTNVGIANYLENSVVLFPNPANEYIMVQSSRFNVQSVEVIDVYGKVINVMNVTENPTRINVHGLASGMYFVRVTTDEGTVTKTFVKK